MKILSSWTLIIATEVAPFPIGIWQSAFGNPRHCPSVTLQGIDAPLRPRYSESKPNKKDKIVAVNSIQLGQVWRSDADGQDYLVTKVYNEVFTQYAMLRPAGIQAPDAPTVRVKVSKGPQGATLPGYAFTQEESF